MTLIEISMLNGYDLAIFPCNGYSRFKLSHDGFIDIYSNDDEIMKIFDEIEKKLEK
jgi:hypothetical protein